MKLTTSLIVILINSLVFAQSEDMQLTPEKTVKSFFELFHAQDTVGMKSLMHEEVVVGTISHDHTDTLLSVSDAQALYKSLAAIPDSLNFQEKLLSIEVKDEGVLAQVWTPYEFYLQGKKSHHGVNAFTLLNTGTGWKIIYLVDTRRRD